jgi:hypothetical protein
METETPPIHMHRTHTPVGRRKAEEYMKGGKDKEGRKEGSEEGGEEGRICAVRKEGLK